VAVTVAVSLRTAPMGALTVATMLMVALAPFARLPRLTVTVPLVPTGGAVTVPWLAATFANTVSTGSDQPVSMTAALCPCKNLQDWGVRSAQATLLTHPSRPPRVRHSPKVLIGESPRDSGRTPDFGRSRVGINSQKSF
jgi:hypothetical protein